MLAGAGRLPHNGGETVDCGGNALCGTCAVQVENHVSGDTIDSLSVRERGRLASPPLAGSSVSDLRLACRVHVRDDLRVRKHDRRWGQTPVEEPTTWYDRTLDGDPVAVSPDEYASSL